MATDQYFAAGWDSIQVGAADSRGCFVGFSPVLTPAATNTGSAMYRLVGGNSAGLSRGEAVEVPINGDDINLANFIFGTTQLPKIPVTMAAKDYDFDNFVTGLTSAVYGNMTINPGIPDDSTPRRMIALLSRQAIDQVTGEPCWEHALCFYVQAREGENAFGFQAAASFGYSLTQNKAARTPYGLMCSDEFGIKKLAYTPITTPNRLTMHAFVGDNTAVAVTVAQTPLTTGQCRVFVETSTDTFEEKACTAINAGSKTITVASGDKPGSGKLRIDLYQFSEWE